MSKGKEIKLRMVFCMLGKAPFPLCHIVGNPWEALQTQCQGEEMTTIPGPLSWKQIVQKYNLRIS